MTKQLIIQIVILAGIVIFYFVYTFRYFRSFKKTQLFGAKLKTFHLIMIWLIPFVWVLILKALSKSAPGSHEIENKEDPKPFSRSGGTMWQG